MGRGHLVCIGTAPSLMAPFSFAHTGRRAALSSRGPGSSPSAGSPDLPIALAPRSPGGRVVKRDSAAVTSSTSSGLWDFVPWSGVIVVNRPLQRPMSSVHQTVVSAAQWRSSLRFTIRPLAQSNRGRQATVLTFGPFTVSLSQYLTRVSSRLGCLGESPARSGCGPCRLLADRDSRTTRVCAAGIPGIRRGPGALAPRPLNFVLATRLLDDVDDGSHRDAREEVLNIPAVHAQATVACGMTD